MPSALGGALAPMHAPRCISWYCLRGGAIRHRNKCAATLHIKRFVGEIWPRDKVSFGMALAVVFITLPMFHRLPPPGWFLSFLRRVHIYPLFSLSPPLPRSPPFARARGTLCSSYTQASLAHLPVGCADFHQVVWLKRCGLAGVLAEVELAKAAQIKLSNHFCAF